MYAGGGRIPWGVVVTALPPSQLLGQETARQKGLQYVITISKRVPPCNHFPLVWQWVALRKEFGIIWLYWPLTITEPWRAHCSEKRAEKSSGQPQFRLTLVPRENRRGKLTSWPRKFWVFLSSSLLWQNPVLSALLRKLSVAWGLENITASTQDSLPAFCPLFLRIYWDSILFFKKKAPSLSKWSFCTFPALGNQ